MLSKVKSVCAILMLLWGLVQIVIPGFDHTSGNVWVIGAILLEWMPLREL